MFTRLRNLGAALLLAVLSVVSLPVHAQALTDTAENRIVDALLRGQSLGAPATWYVSLRTTACSDSAAGSEVAGNNYARPSISASLAAWAGTQGAGTTIASTGTGGQTSNNGQVSFATPSGTWGTVSHLGLEDAVSAGNQWVCIALSQSKTINANDTVSIAAGALTVTLQ